MTRIKSKLAQLKARSAMLRIWLQQPALEEITQ